MNSTFSTLSEGTQIEGSIFFDGDAVLKGAINGQVKCTGAVFVAERSLIDGHLFCGELSLAGHLRGSAEVAGAVQLSDSAIVQGTISCQSIEIESGGLLDMQLNVGG